MTRDEMRTAGLLFGEELALGLVEPGQLNVPEVHKAVRSHPVPSPVGRLVQRVQQRRGALTYDRYSVAPMMAARRAVLGDTAAGRPKVLVRVDEFPHWEAWDQPERYGTRSARHLHAKMTAADVPYLMAVTPRIPRQGSDAGGTVDRPHTDDELELLGQMRRDGVAFGVHGLDHRTRHANRRRDSELTGLRRARVAERLDTAQSILREQALHADVFVPPWNRFDARSWRELATRFDVVCGGPQSVETMGFHVTPSWRGEAVWLPAYAPLHGRAEQVLPAVQALLEQEISLWVPVVLHWGWEHDRDWHALDELCALLGSEGLARPWEDFLLAARASRQLPGAMEREREHG